MFPKILQEMAAKLASSDITIDKVTSDGRVNSALGERQVIEFLQKNFNNVDAGEARNWWDISVTDEHGVWFPVNIKITNTLSADNLSSKEGLFYALTGLDPSTESISINSWGAFFSNLKKFLGTDTTKDYYFLVVDKRPESEGPRSWVASLKTLQTLVANGNNLPFQCRWAENKIPVERTADKSVDFLLHYLAKSVKLRAQILDEFRTNFPNHA